jgi:hypothetical protein
MYPQKHRGGNTTWKVKVGKKKMGKSPSLAALKKAGQAAFAAGHSLNRQEKVSRVWVMLFVLGIVVIILALA